MPRTRRRTERQRVELDGLSRLVPMTAEYLDILRASMPALRSLAEHDVPGVDRDLLIGLLECVRAAVEVDDTPGTPASISAMLAAVARALGAMVR